MCDNESYTFDDEGNPIPNEKPPVSARKPPSGHKKNRKKRRQNQNQNSNAETSTSATSNNNGLPTEGAFTNGAAAVEVTNEAVAVGVRAGVSVAEEPITDMFHIDGTGFDVTLSLALEKIYWESMNPGRRRKRTGSFSGLFKRRKSSSGLKDTNENSIDMQKMIGARIRRRRKAGQSEEEGFVLGMGLFTYEFKDANIMREREIYFEHPSVEICTRWSEKLNGFLERTGGRPKNVKLFLQPYAGEKNGKSIYKHKVLPLFQTADVAIDMTVVQHNEHIKQEMCHLNMDDFDCVIAMGGDGTVNQLLNGLMGRSQKEHGIVSVPGFNPARAMLPMGIIPIGRTNQVAYSMMGTNDIVTACLHILLGNFNPIDVSSIYTTDCFYKWGFNCQYGFGGNVLQFMRRYRALGSKRMDAAFLKALTSSKLRSYECDIEYIPTAGVIGPNFNTFCRTGCELCIPKEDVKASEPEVVTDMVQELNLNSSVSSRESIGSVIELKQDSPWRALKGEYLNVGLFTIPGNCEIAPQGLSKFTHLHDGNLDLVVVKTVERKEFQRFLKRHGNSKNQFDFTFVDVIRCKEVRFRPRMPTSWNYQDHNFSEIKYEMTQQQKKEKAVMQRHKSLEVIDDLAPSRSRAPAIGVTGKAQSMYALDMSDEEEEDDEEEEEGGDGGSVGGGGGDDSQTEGKPERIVDETPVGREQNEASKFQYVGPEYRTPWIETEVARRNKIARKKEEKKKQKEEKKGRSAWNIDGEICNHLELDFRVHSNLLLVCGRGMSPHTEFHDVRFTCLPG